MARYAFESDTGSRDDEQDAPSWVKRCAECGNVLTEAEYKAGPSADTYTRCFECVGGAIDRLVEWGADFLTWREPADGVTVTFMIQAFPERFDPMFGVAVAS